MESAFSDPLRQWIDRLTTTGWLDPETGKRLQEATQSNASPLFETERPPLIVAFFGGTGVGKSTLLNRLAGEVVARTGIERPTSREITVYLHESLPTAALERQLPLENLRLARHRNPNRRDVVWIDMPDIDSVEEHNRELVLQCLPHVDVLIYVVSPERYKDDTGWQMLRQFGHRHGWLFVMNHWDQGHEDQIEDFTRLLREAGFEEPIVLRCDSRENLSERKPDDFAKLEEILTRLVQNGDADRLQQRNLQQRQQEWRRQIENLLAPLEPEKLGELRHQWRTIWRSTCEDLEPALEWPARALAQEIVGKGQKRLRQVSEDASTTLLWDRWSQNHLRDAIDRLVLAANESGLPSTPLKQALQPLRDHLDQTLIEHVQRAVRGALSRPGRGLRRALLWLTGVLRYLLPLAAGGWVAWQVVNGYYLGFTGKHEYFGINFAIHSLLLIGLAWLIPFLLHRLLQPSLEKVAENGIHQGIRSGFEAIEQAVDQRLQRLQEELQALQREGTRLMDTFEYTPPTPASDPSGLLKRIFLHSQQKSPGL